MKKQLSFIIFLLISLLSRAQNVQLTSPTPASPNAAELGKYGEIPVGLSTGIPSISIPIYNISQGKINVPVSMDYHAGGIKVEESASWVGLGWSLQAGGAITRVCRGLPDEVSGYGFKTYGYKVSQYPSNMTQQEQEDYIRGIETEVIDGEPDIFYYNFGNYSGKFMFTNSGEIITFPRNNLKVTYIESPAAGWEIITPDGTKYLFTETEVTTTTPYSGSLTDQEEGNPKEMTSSWFLKSITDIYANTVQFTYEDESISFRTQVQQSTGYIINSSAGDINQCSVPGSYSWSYNIIQGKRLTTISFANGEVSFMPSSQQRLDVQGASLYKIRIKNLTSILKEYEFNTGYFTTASSVVSDQRLKLLDITERWGTEQGKKYSFEYNTMALPGIMSFSQDHWGYYNGAANNTFVSYEGGNGGHLGADREPNPDYNQMALLKKITYPTGGTTELEYECNKIKKWVPEHYIMNTDPSSVLISMNGDNHTTTDDETIITGSFTITTAQLNGQPTLPVQVNISETIGTHNPGDEAFMYYTLVEIYSGTVFSGTLEQLNGATKFLPAGSYILTGYINSDVPRIPLMSFNINLMKADYVVAAFVDFPSAGVRVKKLTRNSLLGTIPEIMLYNYNKFGENYSSGSIGLLPNYISFTDYVGVVQPYTFGDVAYYHCFYKNYSSTSNYPLLTSSGAYVCYKNVTVQNNVNGEIGKTESIFNTFEDYGDITDTDFPFPPASSFEWRRGVLVKETKYKKTSSSFEKVSEEENEYRFSLQTQPDLITKESEGIKIGRNSFTVTVHNFDYGLHIKNYVTYAELSNLISKKTRVYGQANPALYTEVITDYQYSPDNFQLVKVTTHNSKGETEIVNTKYPHDFQSTPTPNVYNSMVSKHIWEPVIEQSLYNNTTFLKSGKTNYNFWYNDTWGTNNSSSLIVPQTAETKSLSYNAEIINRYSSYDMKGNITAAQKENGLQKVYVWGYNKTYVVAEVTGVSYSSIMGILNQSILDNPVSDAALRTELNRIRTSFSAAQAITYTYKPLVGISSQTDFNGITRFFEYDNLGRLTLVRDNDQNIIKKICYNYAGQPEDCNASSSPVFYNGLLSQNFTRNNCGAGYTGSIVTYTVAAATYSGATQTAADLLAQNDINSNGQSYANTHGTCTAIPIFSNVLMSQSFTRNNCGSGYTGSIVTYTVAAGTYTASTQVAADLLAQNDINTNGQSYANTTGTCTAAGCNSSNCSGTDKKCINGSCETGVLKHTASLKIKNTETWRCYALYCFSDGTYSSIFELGIYSNPCFVDDPCQ